MVIHEVAQGTQKWLDLRAGIPAASMFKKIVTPAGELSKSAPKYMQHLLAERILGKALAQNAEDSEDEGFKSRWMAHGNEFEHKAIAAYEWERNVTTRKIGFITTDDGRIGCSPDSFIDEDDRGMVEAKAPSPAVHVGYLLAAAGASKDYKVQMQGQMWLCEKDWNDIVSYSPGMPDAIFRAVRDDAFIAKLSVAVRAFSDLLESTALDFAARGWIKPKAEKPAEDFAGLGISDEEIRQWGTPGVHFV